MRDYPSMPNVFRVASTQNINQLALNGSKDNPYNNNNTVRSVNHFNNENQRDMQQQLGMHQLMNIGTIERNQSSQPVQAQQQPGVINTITGSIPATGLSPSMAGNFNHLRLNNLEYQKKSKSNTNDHQKRLDITPEQSGGSPNANGGWTGLTYTSRGYLWLLTPVAASISMAIVIAALAGPQWLFTEEKLTNFNYNGTANLHALDDGVYITKYTKSSLWIICTTLPGLDIDTYNCIKIDYFPKEGYQADTQDSTPAITYAVTKSCPIFLAAGILLLISFIVFLIPTCSHQNNLYYFAAGILFIISGLIMLIGLVAYISVLKSEIGSKLRPRSSLQPALFKVTYGQSFFLFVFGFIATEFVGVLNIFLYINLQEISYYSSLPCFSATTNVQAKINEGRHPLTESYRRFKQPAAATTANASNHNGLRTAVTRNCRITDQRVSVHPPIVAQRPSAMRNGSNARMHQIHDINEGRFNQTLPGAYSCRKHLNGKTGNYGDGNFDIYLHNDFDRHFYFEKPAVSKCNLHSRSFAKSLNELCTDHLSSQDVFAVPPPPPTFADLPQEFPLTRSVSTTTDIFTSTHPSNNAKENNLMHEQEQSRFSSLKRGLIKTKDELFQEICRQTGVRSKRKDIAGHLVEKPNQKNTQAKDQVNQVYDVDQDHDDEHGFKNFRIANSVNTLDEDQLYVVGDHVELIMPRRSSMNVDAQFAPVAVQSMRRLHSNLSLHSSQATQAEAAWPQVRFTPTTEMRNSCTLPRCFLRRSAIGSQDSLGSLQSNGQQTNRLSQLKLAANQQNQYLSTLTLPQTGESSVQWPATISSSSPAKPFQANRQYPQHPQHPQHPQPMYTASANVASSSSSSNGNHQHNINNSSNQKFKRAYAFDDNQRQCGSSAEAFDLDEIERERRRSHASLFGLTQNLARGEYDLFNGTAV
ncbi:uncharacterized protein Dwil_GK25328 [Drosophila willistoni]|uniref:Voltage-dependent calcium channel gamma-5 subunit n=1 Tax=Drosophila willistoni TaxID=7260 RepID=B4NEA7_DROWI|nr:uncharacterized protein Dwil_GK25328 [Drosophila willistoni]